MKQSIIKKYQIIDLNNIQEVCNARDKFIDIFGKSLIDSAETFEAVSKITHLTTPQYKNGTHPFFEYWHAYKEDVANIIKTGRFSLSTKTIFLINALNYLILLGNIKNGQRIIKSALHKDTFFSAIFEAQTAVQYSKSYEVEVIQEKDDSKTPDLKLKCGNKKIFIECKSLQDFSVQNNRHLQETFDKIFDCCIKHKQSNVVSIKVGKNLDRKDCQRIVKTISDTITKNITGTFIRDDNRIAYTIQKLRDWDVPFIGNGITINRPNNSMFEARGEFKTNGVGLISEAKNFIIVEAESAPDIDFMKRIQGEIKKARKQLPKNKSNLLHIQLPIHADIDFEQVIDTNYYEIKHRLEQDTTNINAIVLSNSHNLLRNHDYRVPLVQHVVIPNKNSATAMPSQFKHIGTIYIPTINVTTEK